MRLLAKPSARVSTARQLLTHAHVLIHWAIADHLKLGPQPREMHRIGRTSILDFSVSISEREWTVEQKVL
jgi:hypothetical protein